ncbi:CD63 antigen [Anoplophora glabripennis]|uniref:CD63 antigen n=1 Tax=Anoplophora glabripennis TaxID=217634 RepID=UPI0008755C20|nr:CD63 antigen [Anoplophora glabripennis]
MHTTSIKHIIYGFNFIFVITGIIMVAVGASVKSHYYPYYTFLDDRYFSLPNMLIATGSLIFFISILGCYGAMRESWITLTAFSILLIIIFIFELSVSIAGYVLNDKTSTYIEATLLTNMNQYGKSNEISNMWDIIQEEFQCCGVQNYTDWNNAFENNSLPISCCSPLNGVVGAFYCNSVVQNVTTTPEPATTSPTPNDTTEASTTIESKPDSNPAKLENNNDNNTTYPASTSPPYSSGCHSLFSDFIKSHAATIGAVGISLAVIQLFGIFLSFYLARQLKNSYYST